MVYLVHDILVKGLQSRAPGVIDNDPAAKALVGVLGPLVRRAFTVAREKG